MAQLGARLNGIEKVVGSNPTGSTYYKFRRSAFSFRQRKWVLIAFNFQGHSRSSKPSASEPG